MATTHASTRDHSKSEGNNSTKTLNEHYKLLMAETDPAKLAADALELVESGGGISPTNLARFKRTVNEKRNDLTGLQWYLTNYLLAGSGLSVFTPTRG